MALKERLVALWLARRARSSTAIISPMKQPDQTTERISKQNSDATESILVRSTNWLGDAVMTLPALASLRHRRPDARICVLTKPGLRPLFESSGVIDEILNYTGGSVESGSGWRSFLRMAKGLRRRRFDSALLFQGAFEAALLALAARIPRRIGYATQGRGLLLTTALEKSKTAEPTHQTLDYLAIVDAATSGTPTSPGDPVQQIRPVLTASESQRAAAITLLAEHGIPPDAGEIAVLNPGATNSRAKRWPESHFAALADELTRATDCRVVLVGSLSEREIAARITSLVSGGLPVNLAGLTDLSTLIGLLSAARVIISNDTGTAHLSAALGRPTLTIFGPTNEFETAPLGHAAEIMRAPGIECERCMLRECPIDHRCMVRILPGEVL
ncbi:MAG: lipopolysaccharide heptosyltransferase II, partial [Acidobacteriota bacterium]